MQALVEKELGEWAVRHRRHLHQYPELSGQELQTCRYIKGQLEELGIPLLAYEEPSVVGFVQGTDGSKTIALRADIDALPVMEEGNKPYRSKVPGISHACGHDGHTAVLLAVAKWLAEHRLEVKPNVLLIFQSSEERDPSGAVALLNQGVLDRVDAIFGIHLWQPLQKGKIGVCHGSMMAACDEFTVTIEGKGGHGAMPQETIDPIYIASQIIGGIQSVVSRSINPLQPAVVTVGRIEGGSTFNIIPNEAVMLGTARSLTEETRQRIYSHLQRMVEGISASYGAAGRMEYSWGPPALVNDRAKSRYAEKVIRERFGQSVYADDLEPTMAAEDFAYYLQRCPGAFIFVGMGGESSAYPHHHPRFDIDEEVIPQAIELFIELVQRYD
ncbi:M20 metallopeptidase family protein [Brevibacillus choshinensis]|uniref:Amidohydrolase n=1 Tax=Brevibacillus choshinensis TaxID=54911 RepID=A0ABX7FJ87_BRECH|nr:M20 family metallopeptidase [Brevibacillus choshinensis]QRG65684.1 amidohydrolase [Brevibacillus choshinensis]